VELENGRAKEYGANIFPSMAWMETDELRESLFRDFERLCSKEARGGVLVSLRIPFGNSWYFYARELDFERVILDIDLVGTDKIRGKSGSIA
jgi:hypothetical protein